jgi:uncharacterized OsmC-like protein
MQRFSSRILPRTFHSGRLAEGKRKAALGRSVTSGPHRAVPPPERGSVMTITTTSRPSRNGVDVPTLFATIDAVRETPAIAAFEFRARNTWQSGTHSRTVFSDFHGATQEMAHRYETVVDSDHPEVLVGADHGPTPVEYLLHAIAACITSGVVNIAAARGVTLSRVSSTVFGTIDLRGILGLSDEVRNGYDGITVAFEIEGDADEETLCGIVEQSRRRSAVYDVLTNGTAVEVDVTPRRVSHG